MVTRRIALAALLLDAVVVLLVAGSLPAFAAAFGVPQDVAGLVFTANGLGFVAAVPTCGLLGDRFGQRTVVALSAAGLAAGLLLFAASRNLAEALAAAAVVGGCGGAVEAGVTALLPELYPGREGFANNFAQGFFGAGAALGPLLLLWPGISWRPRLAVLGALFLFIAAGLWAERGRDEAVRRPPASARPRGVALPPVGGLRALATPGLGATAAAMALYTGVEVAVWGWLFAVVTRPGGAGPLWAVAELSGFWVAMGAGRFLTAALAERTDLPLLIAVGAVLGVVALPLALLAPTPGGALAATVLCGLAFSGIWPSLVAHGQRRCGRTAFISSVLITAGGGGSLAIPAAFGFAAARFGLGPAAAGLAALLAPVAVLPWVRPAAAGAGGGPELGRPHAAVDPAAGGDGPA